MPVAIFDEDFAVADKVMAESNIVILRNMIATTVAAERERCAKIAESYRPGDNIAKEIARLIRVHG